MKDLNTQEWEEQLKDDDNAVILDVRTEIEIEEGAIPNAKNIDIYQTQEFMAEVQELDKAKNYYVYCRSGNRSTQACAILEQQGIENTFNLEGGYTAWNEK